MNHGAPPEFDANEKRREGAAWVIVIDLIIILLYILKIPTNQ